MNNALEKLSKYLKLESDRSYDNRAVLGGLQRMLEPWQEEARKEQLPESLIDLVTARLRDYGRLSPSSRYEALRGLWTRLRESYPDLPSDLLRAPATDPEPAASPPSSPAAVAPPPGDAAASQPEAEPRARPVAVKAPPVELSAPLTEIQGIGPKSAKTLAKLGLQTLGDLLWHLPRRYDDYTQLETINRLWYGQEVTVIGTIEAIQVREVRNGRMKLTEATVSDGTGSLKVTWFNQPWIARRLKPGRAVVLSGKVDQYLGHLTMNNPEWEPLERRQLHTNRIVPVYPLTAGVSGKWLRRVMHSVVARTAPHLPDPLPDSIRRSANLVPLSQAIQQIHFPDSWERLREAQHRLAFDEMFMLQLGVMRQKREWETLQTEPLPVEDAWITSFKEKLPFALTGAQEKALRDIRADMASPRPMNRLLQGDVGSGKTVVAAAAAGMAIANGAQSAFMAPTSILAEQHLQTLRGLLPSILEIPVESIQLLIGATPEAEKARIREGLDSGDIKVVVGTHALIEDPVSFHRLGLAVIDEQHRFGVHQRAALRAKGANPNLLVMTATPIPRSLALTVYGDLDLTLLDEMPPGRKPVETRALHPRERLRAYSFITSQLEQGRQAFIIFPLVEESDKFDARAAVDEHRELQETIFARFRVGLLHGRMKPEEKEQVMRQFRAGEIDVLVSTSVVEVGVDVPNATVMLVEGANRFGLAQLHQFRGRVGRGQAQSYCLLIPDTEDATDNARLQAMQSTNDGFQLAEMDLSQRGPGDFLGTRQSGFVQLRMAQLTDLQLIEKARREARRLFDQDPELHMPEHRLLAEELERLWTIEKGEIS